MTSIAGKKKTLIPSAAASATTPAISKSFAIPKKNKSKDIDFTDFEFTVVTEEPYKGSVPLSPSSNSASSTSSINSSFSSLTSPASTQPNPNLSFHSSLAVHKEELDNGLEVTKVTRHGSFKKTKIFLYKKDDIGWIVTWDSNKRKNNSEETFIRLIESRLEIGKFQGAFHRLTEKNRSKIHSHQCFSLLGNNRSLDIICPTAAQAGHWIATLTPLLLPFHTLPPCQGRFLRSFGKEGNEKGEYSLPLGMAVSHITGHLYIVDSNNSRIVECENSGKVVRVFGSKGAGDNQFVHPSDISITDENTLYVTDTGNSRITVHSNKGSLIEEWSDDNADSSPVGISIGVNSQNIYIGDQAKHKIQTYRPDGEFIHFLGGTESKEESYLNKPVGVSTLSHLGEDQIYVVDQTHHRILVFSSRKEFLFAFGKKGTKNGDLITPKGVACDSNRGLVYVVDSDNHRIQVFDKDGNFVRAWGREGFDECEFNKPTYIALCPLTGLVYVSDTKNNRVQVFY